jgi:hypothetical protein
MILENALEKTNCWLKVNARDFRDSNREVRFTTNYVTSTATYPSASEATGVCCRVHLRQLVSTLTTCCNYHCQPSSKLPQVHVRTDVHAEEHELQRLQHRVIVDSTPGMGETTNLSPVDLSVMDSNSGEPNAV